MKENTSIGVAVGQRAAYGTAPPPARAATVWVIEEAGSSRAETAPPFTMATSPEVRWFRAPGSAQQALAQGATFDVALVALSHATRGDRQQLIRGLRRRSPAAAIVVYGDRPDDAAVVAALRSGASGYVDKDLPHDVLRFVLQATANGMAPLSAGAARKVLSAFWEPRLNESGCHAAEPTPREREVLELLYTGATYRDIARFLAISVATVQTHVKHIYAKLGVTNRAEAIRFAFETGYLKRAGEPTGRT